MNTMRTYHIRYPRNFSNEYDLCYCTSDQEREEATAAGYERITLKEAIRKCSNERWARRHNPNNSGYGDKDIVPWAYVKKANKYEDYLDPEYDCHLRLNGYIWE